jgi:hypothetical protein
LPTAGTLHNAILPIRNGSSKVPYKIIQAGRRQGLESGTIDADLLGVRVARKTLLAARRWSQLEPGLAARWASFTAMKTT